MSFTIFQLWLEKTETFPNFAIGCSLLWLEHFWALAIEPVKSAWRLIMLFNDQFLEYTIGKSIWGLDAHLKNFTHRITVLHSFYWISLNYWPSCLRPGYAIFYTFFPGKTVSTDQSLFNFNHILGSLSSTKQRLAFQKKWKRMISSQSSVTGESALSPTAGVF